MIQSPISKDAIVLWVGRPSLHLYLATRNSFYITIILIIMTALLVIFGASSTIAVSVLIGSVISRLFMTFFEGYNIIYIVSDRHILIKYPRFFFRRRSFLTFGYHNHYVYPNEIEYLYFFEKMNKGGIYFNAHTLLQNKTLFGKKIGVDFKKSIYSKNFDNYFTRISIFYYITLGAFMSWNNGIIGISDVEVLQQSLVTLKRNNCMDGAPHG